MVDFKDYTYKMDRTLEVLQEDFGAVRAGRANARVLDRISVEYYGVDTPIGQVGTIASPDARTLVIQPWDGSLLKKIEKAIQTSDLGINPQNDGRVIRLVFPQLTEERRRELTKHRQKELAGQEVRRGCQGCRAQHPPRCHGLCQGSEEEVRDHRGRPEEGREGPAGPDR